MSPFRYRDDDSSTGTAIAGVLLGAIAGFAVGMFVAQRVGGFSGIAARIKKRTSSGGGDDTRVALDPETADTGADDEELDEVEEDSEFIDDGVVASAGDDEEGVPLLEERVLEAFNNDPVLAERAIDIGAIGSGVIELAGWVDDEHEAEHAMTIAHGVPGVVTVVNRLMAEDEERQLDDNSRRVRDGDPALTESRWEGQQVGTGRRRQGTSNEVDRHADPKAELGERWLSQDEAVKHAADDIAEIKAERRSRKGGKAEEASRGD
jgi:BON domain